MWDVEAWGLRGDPLPLPLPPLRAMQVSELERFVQWNADPWARAIPWEGLSSQSGQFVLLLFTHVSRIDCIGEAKAVVAVGPEGPGFPRAGLRAPPLVGLGSGIGIGMGIRVATDFRLWSVSQVRGTAPPLIECC